MAKLAPSSAAARGTRSHRLIAAKELVKTFVDFRKLSTAA